MTSRQETAGLGWSLGYFFFDCDFGEVGALVFERLMLPVLIRGSGAGAPRRSVWVVDVYIDPPGVLLVIIWHLLDSTQRNSSACG